MRPCSIIIIKYVKNFKYVNILSDTESKTRNVKENL